ncbi:estradiol 17-beta-dehydrogenase 8-like isoform X1 [Varroa jacobsoni]|uniref:estradiol 17-beta-dehydrogenase 8-like isoform X1 n=1 Tax=Varroa jacobsoni TaxID=62625 RepID=UPI000BF30EAD|nr:estradiol 17-beta-dehydrogenase 8-like isoform X1 [Varroa jacobsoni]XP_022708403.1 estradiol 17-beta-dehydrogenase 8-like isoform X1 [Varroa jacobsoni]
MAISAASLAGRIALVTGGASGIGRAVCVAFAQEGARCVVADRNISDAQRTQHMLEKAHDGEHSAIEMDVSNSHSVSSGFIRLKELQSRPADIIVNCAGITSDGFLLNMTETMFDEVIKINLKGTFLVTQQGAKEMVAAQLPGSIVNISSIMGKTGNIGQTNYAASKAGVVGFTKSAAQELAKFNIRCNAVMPGLIDTPMITTVPEKITKLVVDKIPLRRKGSPEEVAEVVRFLASNESSYVTGGVIEVTGGLFM